MTSDNLSPLPPPRQPSISTDAKESVSPTGEHNADELSIHLPKIASPEPETDLNQHTASPLTPRKKSIEVPKPDTQPQQSSSEIAEDIKTQGKKITDMHAKYVSFDAEFKSQCQTDSRDILAIKTNVTVIQLFKELFSKLISHFSTNNKLQDVTNFIIKYQNIKIDLRNSYQTFRSGNLHGNEGVQQHISERLTTLEQNQTREIDNMLAECESIIIQSNPHLADLSPLINPAGTIDVCQKMIDSMEVDLKKIQQENQAKKSEGNLRPVDTEKEEDIQSKLDEIKRSLKSFKLASETLLEAISSKEGWPPPNVTASDLSELKEQVKKLALSLVSFLKDHPDNPEITQSLWKLQKASKEVEHQQELLFQRQFDNSSKTAQQLFTQTQQLWGESPIPIEFKLAIIDFVNINHFQIGFSDSLEQAKLLKEENLELISQGITPEHKSQLINIINELIESQAQIYDYSDNPQYKKFMQFITNVNAKIGTGSNLQIASDSLGGVLGPLDLNLIHLDSELQREMGSLSNQRILADGLDSADAELAHQGYRPWEGYNLQMKNEWKLNQVDNGALTSIQWTGYAQLKQEDGSYKLFKSGPFKVDFSDISPEDYKLAWAIVTLAFRKSGNYQDINFMDLVRDLLPKDNDEALAKYNAIMGHLNASNQLENFRNKVEYECVRMLMEHPDVTSQ